MQRLVSHGIEAEEHAFTATSTGRMAAALFNAIRDKAVALPPDDDLLDELAHMRLRESSFGVFRLDHDAGRFDDCAVALALVVSVLLQDEVAEPAFGECAPPARGTLAGDYVYERGELAGSFNPSGLYDDGTANPIDSWTLGGDW
jgi:hypothetical protein